MSRLPSPVTRRPTRAWRSRVFAMTFVAAAVLVAHGGGTIRAADGDGASVLERPIVDAAFIERGAGRTPDLLTVAVSDEMQLRLLRRGATWAVQSETQLTLPGPSDRAWAWLVELGPTDVAMVAPTGDGTTVVWRIHVDESGTGALTVGPPMQLGLQVTDAGVADATGDGVPDLVVAGGLDVTSDCPSLAIAVLSGQGLTLAFQQSIKLPGVTNNLRLGGATLGEWDGRPGIDLLANTFETCPSLPDYGEPHHLVVVRLSDGVVVVDRPTTQEEAAAANPWPNPPLALDLDGDGRNEAIVATDAGLSVLDPADGWRSTPLTEEPAVVMAALPPAGGMPGASVTWAATADEASTARIGVARLSKDGRTIAIEPSAWHVVHDATDSDIRGAVARMQGAAYDQEPTSAWVADIDGDGCPDVVAPMLWIGCKSDGPQRGASWLTSRPLALVGDGADRRVLVADRLDWQPYLGGGQGPRPAAAGTPGAWRSGGSSPFVLAEVPLATVTASSDAPVEAPTIGHAASRDGVIEMGWPPGLRLLIRAVPLSLTAPSPESTVLATRAGFLTGDTTDGELDQLLPAVAATSGPSTSSTASYDLLDNVVTSDGQQADRWLVTAASLDASGAISDPVQVTAVVDRVAPDLSLVAPPFSLPWPFSATLHGTSEAGASVSLPGASPVVVGSDGSFELPAQLAPWPQTLQVSAVDPASNATLSQISVMGGADLQDVPWPGVGAVVVLAAAFVTSMRGVRPQRAAVRTVGARGTATSRVQSPTAGAEDFAVIEDLPSGWIPPDD